MREDVEQARPRRLPERLEVASPQGVGALRAMVPDLVAVVVDGMLADEVHRADDVVPVARLQQRRCAVLTADDEIRLDAELEVGLLAHEARVVVDVVDRALAPQRVTPDLQRLREAVDVLRAAELADPALLGDRAIALGVRAREVHLRVRAAVVGAQVQVKVGQHRAPIPAQSGSRASGTHSAPRVTVRHRDRRLVHREICTAVIPEL